jgi:teichuronic acid biosynthesis glycosyltransferase TuaG
VNHEECKIVREELVSVVMPVYNADKFLRKSIDSVLRQTHRALELIAVDDCSDDQSWALIEEYAAADDRVRAIRLDTNGGVAAARNVGVAAASGSHVAFLDSDDWWDLRKLELQLRQMIQSGERVSYTSYDRVTEDGALLSRVRPPASVSFKDMLKSNRICHSTGMYDRSLGDTPFQAVGHEDYVFWLEMVRRAGRAIRVGDPEPLAWYVVRSGSVSANKLMAARWQWRIYRNSVKLDWGTSSILMVHYVWNAVHKRR